MRGEQLRQELEADEFAGYVTSQNHDELILQYQLADIGQVFTDEATESYPGKADRLAAITKGWREGPSLTQNGLPDVAARAGTWPNRISSHSG